MAKDKVILTLLIYQTKDEKRENNLVENRSLLISCSLEVNLNT
jgi:hypothetical protein